METDLWHEATRDIVAEGRARNLEMAKAASQGTWEFLALAQSPQEYGDRVALAADLISTTASVHDVSVGDLVGVFDNRFALLMEAKGNPFGKDSDDDKDDDDSSDSSDDSDDDSSDDDDSDDDDSDDDKDPDDDGDDDTSAEGDTDGDHGTPNDTSDDNDPYPSSFGGGKYSSLMQSIQSGANPLEWGGTPFAHSSARKVAADGAEQVTDINNPEPVDPMVPGMEGGIAETTKPRQLPEGGGGMDPTMAPGMGMDGIGEPPPDAPTDPAMNGGDIQQSADTIPPADDAGRTAKIHSIAAEVRKYNPTLSPAQCRKVAARAYDQYLSKHAEDMNPLLFGDRGDVADGPLTHKVKTWSPKDFQPYKKPGEADGAANDVLMPGGGGAAAGEGAAAAEEVLPMMLAL